MTVRDEIDYCGSSLPRGYSCAASGARFVFAGLYK